MNLQHQQTVLISLPVDELQLLIIDCVNSCLKHHVPCEDNRQEPNESRILDGNTLAKELGITIQTLINWRKKKGIIPYLQIGSSIRYDYNQVIRALQKNKGGHKK